MEWEEPLSFFHPNTAQNASRPLVDLSLSHSGAQLPYPPLAPPSALPPSHVDRGARGRCWLRPNLSAAVCSRSRASDTINTSVSQKKNKPADRVVAGAARTEIDNEEKPNRCGSVALNRGDVSSSDAVTRRPAAFLPSDLFVLLDVFTAKDSAGWAGALAGQPSVFY